MLESIARFFVSGGPFMWVLMTVLATALAVIIERLIFFLGTCRDHPGQLVADVVKALNKDKPKEALALVSHRDAPVNNIVRTTIERYEDGYSFKEIRQGVEEVAIKEVPRLSQRINYLAMFANIATLAGLLGTIFGLQQSFSSLAVAEASQKAAMLASGISQAMNTTALGLMVAIPCLIAFTKLTNMNAEMTEDLDASSVKLLNYLEHKMESESWSREQGSAGRLVSQSSQESSLSIS